MGWLAGWCCWCCCCYTCLPGCSCILSSILWLDQANGVELAHKHLLLDDGEVGLGDRLEELLREGEVLLGVLVVLVICEFGGSDSVQGLGRSVSQSTRIWVGKPPPFHPPSTNKQYSPSQRTEEDAAEPARLPAVLDDEVLVGPLLELGVVGVVVLVAHLLWWLGGVWENAKGVCEPI